MWHFSCSTRLGLRNVVEPLRRTSWHSASRPSQDTQEGAIIDHRVPRHACSLAASRLPCASSEQPAERLGGSPLEYQAPGYDAYQAEQSQTKGHRRKSALVAHPWDIGYKPLNASRSQQMALYAASDVCMSGLKIKPLFCGRAPIEEQTLLA